MVYGQKNLLWTWYNPVWSLVIEIVILISFNSDLLAYD